MRRCDGGGGEVRGGQGRPAVQHPLFVVDLAEQSVVEQVVAVTDVEPDDNIDNTVDKYKI